jgi:hypothetical protein
MCIYAGQFNFLYFKTEEGTEALQYSILEGPVFTQQELTTCFLDVNHLLHIRQCNNANMFIQLPIIHLHRMQTSCHVRTFQRVGCL